MTYRLPPARHPLDELVHAPEMATLRLIDEALHILELGLITQHPCLCMQDVRYAHGVPNTLRSAKTLLRRATALRDAMLRYTLAVHDAIRPPTLPPDDIF